MKNRKLMVTLLMVIFCGCAGLNRECSSCCACAVGSDWIVVQMDMYGHPFRCWELKDTSIDNEYSSDGIYWQTEEGHLIHISGLYNRVQVKNGLWDEAFEELGLTRESCKAIRAGKLENIQNDNI